MYIWYKHNIKRKIAILNLFAYHWNKLTELQLYRRHLT